jgi:TRAP-type C4-dicarboxylate transport system substrate-binding protein
MRRTLIARVAATVAVAGLVTAGCTSNDRAGGNAGTTVTTLTLGDANGSPPKQLLSFADNVDKLSHGGLKIEFRDDVHHPEPEYETSIVQDVKEGTFDLAWVGPRVFDTLGATDFQPMLAPLLIDSQDLQGKVFDAGIPDEMLAGVDAIGVVGVGILPGPLRRPLSKAGTLTSPDAFRGKVVGTQTSALSEAAYRALGATTVHLGTGAPIDQVDAYDPQVGLVWLNHYEEQGAKDIVGNVNLWPRPLAIIAGPEAWERLTDEQRKILQDAAKVAQSAALDASRSEDTDALSDLCGAGIAVSSATPEQLAAFETAFEPVYEQIESAGAASKAWLEKIRALKADSATPPDSATCEGADAKPRSEGVLPDGTYGYTADLTADIQKYCEPGDPFYEAAALGLAPFKVEMEVKGDRIREYDYATGTRQLGWTGSYKTYRDNFELAEDDPGVEPVVFDFSFDSRSLTLANPRPNACDDMVVWASHPWVLQSAAGVK